MHGAYLHYPNTPSWRGAQLKHRDNFTFYLYFLGSNPGLLLTILSEVLEDFHISVYKTIHNRLLSNPEKYYRPI
jgi:hypothetical protein